MGHKSVVPFLGELSSNGNNWIALGGGKKYGQAGATIISPAGRWSLLTVNPVAAAEAKVEFYANGVKRFELVLPNAAGPFIDTTGFYDAEEGDEVSIVFVRSNAFNRQVRYTASMQFEAEGGTGPVAFHHSSRSNSIASTDNSTLVFGHEFNSSQTTQLSRTPSSFQSSGVLSHLRVVCDNNPAGNAVTATIHVNGVPSNLSVSFGAGFVGTVDNIIDTVSVSPDDLVTIVCDQLPNSGFYRLDQVSVRFTSTDGAYDLFNYPTTANLSLLPNGNVFATVGAGTFATNTSSGLILPHDVEVSKGRIVTGASDKVARMGFYSQGWFDTFDTEPSASISEHISAGLGTTILESAWIALGKSALISVGSSERLKGAVGITLREKSDQPPATNVFPLSGSLILTGSVPEVLAAIEVDPLNGVLVLTGEYPTVHTETIVEPSSGSLAVSGSVPTIRVGSYVTPSTGEMELSGLYPIVYTLKAVISSQIPVMMLAEPEAPPARSSQISVSTLAEPVAPPVKSSQTPIAVLGEPIAPVRSSQNMVAILAHGSPCTTQRCQIWTIHRRDGKIFRFTSHDEEVKRGPAVYLPCKSLNPTAAENASTLGSVGNIELTGIIDHDSITEADLYGGLFDDAFVTVDLYSWGDRRVSPRRLAAGWTGSIGTGDTGFTLEILGPGSRLEQQALVQMITPSCRWIFGSPQCGVNIEAMKVPSVVVKAHSRGSMRLDLPAEPTDRQWSNGRIRFITGPNAGITVETKTVDFTSGEVVLWQSPGFLPEPGDEVEILPGCDFNRDGGCKVYNNVINFGGFPDVPGSDALLETPDAKY